uniref:Ribosomal protein L37 n=1 Tax=Zooxanthella nutricula TaxID=1333877 RepID=A0A7S2N0I1_9DINO
MLFAAAAAGGAGLVFGGVSLARGQRLADVPGLEEGSTVHAVPRLAGGGDGTEAMGKKNKKSHGLCIRCGKRAFHLQKKRCASCGYPATKIRSYEWAKKAKRRRAPGTGRQQYVKTLARRFKNKFREGTTPTARKKRGGSQ